MIPPVAQFAASVAWVTPVSFVNRAAAGPTEVTCCPSGGTSLNTFAARSRTSLMGDLTRVHTFGSPGAGRGPPTNESVRARRDRTANARDARLLPRDVIPDREPAQLPP